MKKLLLFLSLTLVLGLAGSSFAVLQALRASDIALSDASEQSAAAITDQEIDQNATLACPSQQGLASRVNSDPTNLMSQVAPYLLSFPSPQEPVNASLVPKICPVDCTPCSTPADCWIGGCKAIQCP